MRGKYGFAELGRPKDRSSSRVTGLRSLKPNMKRKAQDPVTKVGLRPCGAQGDMRRLVGMNSAPVGSETASPELVRST